jgi:hypothetical protein
MTKMIKFLPLTLVALLALLAVRVVWAQSGDGFDLSWWTVDGGGGEHSGDGYTMVGTIGQPEPGPALVGDGYKLTGGFWPGEGEAPSTCEKLNGVAISGPTSGSPGNYSFNAITSPADATQPITFLWDNGGSTDWSDRTLAAGTHTLSVTATNCNGSAQVSDDHMITINAPPPGCTVALTQVEIGGPTSGQTGTSYTFTANTTPASADLPIVNTWTPSPDSGQDTANASYTWSSTGTKTISVTASNCGGADSDLHQIVISGSPSGSQRKIFLPLIQR